MTQALSQLISKISMNNSSRKKTNWLQLSLKTLLVLTILGGFLSLRTSIWVKQSIEQRSAVDEIESGLGAVTYASSKRSPFWQKTLEDQLGKDFTNDVVAIHWKGDWATEAIGSLEDSTLDSVLNLRNLEQFNGSGAFLKTLEPLTEMESLTSIDMDLCTIESLEGLEQITKLNSLSLKDCNFQGLKSCDSLLARMENMNELRKLVLGSPATVEQIAIERLSRFDSLESLSFTANNNVDDLSPLSKLTHLRSLRIIFDDRIDEIYELDLSFLKDHPNLETLTLEHFRGDLKPLLEVPNLANLILVSPTIRSVKALDQQFLYRLKTLSLTPAAKEFVEIMQNWEDVNLPAK